jgi:hypothetical protein
MKEEVAMLVFLFRVVQMLKELALHNAEEGR